MGWIRRILPFLKVRPGNLLLAFGAVVVAGTAGAVLLLVQRQVLDLAVAGRLDAMAVPLGLLLGVGVLMYVTQRLAAYRELKAANDAQFLVFDAVHRRMQRIDPDGQSMTPGQLAARLNLDINTMSRAVASLPKLAGVAVTTAGTIALMLSLEPVLGAVTLAVIPLLVLVTRRARTRVQPATFAAQQQEAEVAQRATMAIAGVRVVKALKQEEREIERMAAAAGTLFGARMRGVRLQAFYAPLIESFSGLVQVAVVVVGGWLMLRGDLTLGTFLAFSVYNGQLVGTVKWFAETVIDLQEAGVCANRVLDLLDVPAAVVESPSAVALPPARGALTATGLRFSYGDGPAVLDGLDLTVRAGETVALVGPSGSGKSTLVKLLGRFHDPSSGTVAIDGHDLRTVTLESLRHEVGVVFDDPMLFTGTIGDNIAYGRPDAPYDEIVRAAETAGAHEFVSLLPDGYDTVVGERGFTLSGGQRQRIALARTLLTGPRILLLDDPTAGVDAELERTIHKRLREHSGGRTTVFVGYRASTLAVADRIAVLDAGRVVDEGTHDELMDRCPLYASLLCSEATAAQPAAAGGWDSAAVPAPDALGGDAAMRAAVARLAPIRDTVSAPVDDDGPFSLWRLLRPYRAAIATVLALLVVQTAVGVFSPSLTQRAIDRGVLAGSVDGLVGAALAILGLSLVGLVLAPVTMRLAGRVGQQVVYALRMRVFTRLVRLPIAYYERHRAGRLLTRVISDVEAFAQFASTGLVTAIVSGLTVVGVLAVMLAADPVLAGLVAASVVPFVLLLRILNARIAANFLGAREQLAEANAALQENLAGVREAQSFGQQQRQHDEYRRLIRQYLDHRLAAERLIAASYPVVSFLSGLALSLVLGVGAVRLASGDLSAGELIAFVLWVSLFFPPIVQLGMFFSSDVKRVEVSTRLIGELMAESAAPTRTGTPVRPVGELVLDGVRFRYPGTRRDVLHGVDLRVPAGTTVALVGATGAGKSTVFKLLAGFYRPTGGRILVDGTELSALDLGYLPQEPYLFAGSIRDNIAYGRPEATDADVEAAARAVGAHEGICALAGGYRHVVGERGGGLSAGLRQLVCLARTYLVDPGVVLLDEATAKLDLATEARVLAAIRTVAAGRTTLMIAHRLQTAMVADWIAVVDDGRIVEEGTHEELLAIGGRYATLYGASLLVPAA